MTGTETTIIRFDGDNYPLSVNVETGVVERRNSYYPAKLKGEGAWRLFIDLVGLAHSHEVPALILACNRAAARKQLADEARHEVAMQYAGIASIPVKAAKPHGDSCPCPKCRLSHVRNGCRRLRCPVCG